MMRSAFIVVFLASTPAALAQPQPDPVIAESAAWTPRHGERIAFDVYRDGQRFGRHIVSFVRSGDTLTVSSDIELKVALGPLTVFHYVHQATETYAAGKLASVSSRTKKDGKWKTLAAEATASGLKIAGAAFKGVHAGAVIPSTHWNIAQMRQPAMLSTETGAMLPMQVSDKGIEKVKTASGEIEARRYLVRSDMDASFWYDAAGRWVSCAFTAQGSDITYVLRD
jgi:hypothetical protein